LSTVELGDMGAPIRGPSALAGDWRRFWYLTFAIARTEFKLRFYGSGLGYLWQLVRPLLMFGVLEVVYSLGKLGNTPHYPAMLLSGVVMYTFFVEATAGAVRSVVDREDFVRKIQFPRLAIPLAVVMTAVFNLCVNFSAVAIFVFLDGARPRVQWLELPVILLVLVLFATGCAMLLSALFVRYRDMQPIWDVVCQMLFYASLILIPIEKIGPPLHPAKLLHVWMLNPLADLMQQFRHALLGPVPTVVIDHVRTVDKIGGISAAAANGGYAELAIPMGFIAAIFVFGFWYFNHAAPDIADNL
jgi:ABC-2 type transport system permease protein